MASLSQRIKGSNFKIYENYKIWFIIPLIIVGLSLIICTIYAFTPSVGSFASIGIDFQGGTVLTVEMTGADMNTTNYDKNVEIIERVVENNNLKVSVDQASGSNAIIVRYTNFVNGENYNTDAKSEEMSNLNRKVALEVEEALVAAYPDANVEVTANFSLTSALASSKLIRTALISVSISLLIVLVYIMFRFDLLSGISAVIALLHDVAIAVLLTFVFRIQINSSFVAAIITIVAYSLNNTIIVFDRVRDNKANFITNNQRFDFNVLVDKSVKETLARSIYTSITTLIMISFLAILGVSSIREFSLPIIFGLIAGAFSSAFVAPCVWALLMQKFVMPKKQLAGTSKQGSKGASKSKGKAIAYK